MSAGSDKRGQDDTHRNALRSGYQLHWYRIERVLGQGGFGITYLAFDANLHQQVAIKEYLPMDMAVREGDHSVHPASRGHDERYQWGLERFLTEARTLAKFKHPAIVRVLSVFEANNTAYMVMEYERGETLQDVLTRRKALPEAEIVKLLFPILDGLQLIHAAGFIHRDVKPANIFVRTNGTPVLIDFGSARQAVGQTRTLTSIVSPGYAPYEQYFSKSDRQGPWTDIYGLGATLYRAVAGRAPMDAIDRSEAILKAQNDTFVKAVEIGQGHYSPRLLAAIDHALRFNETERPQSVAEWARDFGIDEALRTAVETPLATGRDDKTDFAAGPRSRPQSGTRASAVDAPTRAAQTTKATPVVPSAASRRIAVPLGAGAVAVLAVLAVFAFRYWQEKPVVPRYAAIESTRPPSVSTPPPTVEPEPPASEATSPPSAGEPPAMPVQPPPGETGSASAPPSAVEPLPAAADAQPPPLEAMTAPEDLPPAAEPPPVEMAALPDLSDEAPPADSAAPAPDAIATLLAQAAEDFKADRLTTPPGHNAYHRYRAVLDRDPGNAAARKGIAAIADRYAALARHTLASGNLDRAEALVNKGLVAQPESASLKAAQDELAAARQAQATRAAGQATAATEEAAPAAAPGEELAIPPPEQAVAPPARIAPESIEPQVAAAVAPAPALPPPKPRMALRVIGVPSDFRRYGLDPQELYATVSDRLRAAGYEVLAFDGAPPDALAADLELHYAYNDTTGIYSYSASFEIRPLAEARGNPDSKPAWTRGGTGWARDIELRKVREVFLKAVDQFLGEQPLPAR